MPKKTDAYDLYIKNGYPPPKLKTRYESKLPSGVLIEIGKRIKPGQYVENLSAGSAGKLRGFVEERGLAAIQRMPQGGKRATLYVVTKKWLNANEE